MCVQSQQQLAKVGRRIRPCVHGDVCDSRRAGRVRARKSRICCQRVFLFWCKPGWQLTQLSPSTCLVTSLSFHSSLCMQKCTDPALLCSLPHTDNSAGVDAPQCLQVAPLIPPTGTSTTCTLTPYPAARSAGNQSPYKYGCSDPIDKKASSQLHVPHTSSLLAFASCLILLLSPLENEKSKPTYKLSILPD